MNSDRSLIPVDPGILELIHGSREKSGTLQPFAREVMLVKCHVAGVNGATIKTIEADLQPGSTLVLRREPENVHDVLAIIVLDASGRKLGYIPKLKNEAPARLMDVGKLLFARLISKEWKSDWICIEVEVYLRDL